MTSRTVTIKEYPSHQASPKKLSRKGSDDFSSVPEEAEKIRDKSNPAGNVYTIRSGDTLYVIAKQLKTKHNLPLLYLRCSDIRTGHHRLPVEQQYTIPLS
jgi:LysM repeat protein